MKKQYLGKEKGFEFVNWVLARGGNAVGFGYCNVSVKTKLGLLNLKPGDYLNWDETKGFSSSPGTLF